MSCDHPVWVCWEWNSGPNYETTARKCLECGKIRRI